MTDQGPMHERQLTVTPDLVRRLLDDQLPQHRHLPLRPVAGGGTVCAVLRLGEGLAVRLPLTGDDPVQVRAGLEAEAQASAALAAICPAPAPLPVTLCRPGHGYPLPWSVQTWVPGHDALVEDPAGSSAFAEDLAAVLDAFRTADTSGRTFVGEQRDGRGGHLPDHDEWVAHCLGQSVDHDLDTASLAGLWADLRDLPPAGPDVMTHGDLMPGNVIVTHGRLGGLLDTGGFGPADRALDLVAAWHLLHAPARAVLRDQLGCTDLEWARGRAWALQQALGLVWYYARTHPVISATGRRTLARVLTG
ncbi:phosphotransferase [Nocardioides sp. AX2bis]|uniref:phosphotransferase n=1 Tax=Nocardioides sp. AX2bis TaxID=2653157 RepID=UPI0012F0CE8E|nr:phosphotransferase [Nocardioides sp. AX2bis]VXB57263.1 Predicted kinase, aminoglycoside phosphotransferase (APT) family [Nocardioides sp. AX2bis]